MTEQLWREKRHYKEQWGHIRGCPVGCEKKTSLDQPDRKSYDFHTESEIVLQIEKATERLKQALKVRLLGRVALKSTQGTRRQVLHYDFKQNLVKQWQQRKFGKKKSKKVHPWTLLVSLQAHGKLIVCVLGNKVEVPLGAGDAILFRYDVFHGGARYSREHWRMHEYWVPEGCDLDLRSEGNKGDQVALHKVEQTDTWNPNDASTTENPRTVYVGEGFSVTALAEALG